MSEWVEYTDALLEPGCEIRCDTGCEGLVGIVGRNDNDDWYLDWGYHELWNPQVQMGRYQGNPGDLHRPPNARLSIRAAGPPNY
jgi:hypothetical protein